MRFCPVADWTCPYCAEVDCEVMCMMEEMDGSDPEMECDAFWGWEDDEE